MSTIKKAEALALIFKSRGDMAVRMFIIEHGDYDEYATIDVLNAVGFDQDGHIDQGGRICFA